MFYSLTGKIVHIGQSFVALSCSGVSFKCTVSLNTLKKIGAVGTQATLYTYMAVRDDAIELFGFADTEELEYFKLLMGVSGVGPKAAVSVLSVLTPRALALCIATGDVKALKAAPNIGAKTAQRILLELKDKISKTVPEKMDVSDFSPGAGNFNGNVSEAVSALVSLGFSASDAAQALSTADSEQSVEELIKLGLKMLSQGI